MSACENGWQDGKKPMAVNSDIKFDLLLSKMIKGEEKPGIR